MPYYRIEYYDKKGEKKAANEEASSEAELLRSLSSRGKIAVSIKKAEPRGASLFIGRSKKLTLEEQRLFCSTLRTFLRSGLPLALILDLLLKQTRDKSLKSVYIKLKESVEAGHSLSFSMRELNVFRETISGMVESGEKSASLPELLDRAAEMLSDEIALRRKITSSLTYPLLMFLTGTAVIIFLLSFVVPRLTEIVLQSGAELPFITKLLIALSKALRMAILPLGAAALGYAVYLKKRGRRLSIPFFRGIKENIAFSIIFSQIGAVTSAGIPLVRALLYTAPLDPEKGRLRFVAEHIKQGYRFSQALEKQGSFPEEMIAVVRVGELGSDLPNCLRQIGSNCRENAQSSMERYSSLVEPAIIIIMGIAVGFIVMAILLPIFNLSALSGV